MSDSKNPDLFPVIPGIDEYEVLSFLVRNREDEFSPSEIAVHIGTNKASASTTLTRLFEKGLIECSQGVYYVDLDRAEYLQNRLESVDAAEHLHNTTPDDDIYSTSDWEEELDSC